MERVYVICNDIYKYTLEVDHDMYRQLLSDNALASQYCFNLKKAGFMEIEEEISSIKISTDDSEYQEIFQQAVQQALEVNKDEEGLWSETTTKLLLDKYQQYLPEVGPMKKFKKKKHMWERIASDIETILNKKKTALQCENRFKTVLKRKKKSTGTNTRTGEAPQRVEFADELEKIKAIDDSVEPEVLVGVGKTVHQKKENKRTCSDNMEGKQKVKRISESTTTNVSETLWKIQKDREERKDQRHQEKMQLLREIKNKICGNVEENLNG